MKSDYFHKINTEEKAYWLGFILGDGCLYLRPGGGGFEISIDLSVKDDQHLDKFAQAIDFTGKKYYRTKISAVKLHISNKQMFGDLVRLGITPKKSLTAKWPKIPKKYEMHMLRGLFDADGCITSEGAPYYTPAINMVGTKDCLENAARLFNITNKIFKRVDNAYQFSKSGTFVIEEIYKKLYKNATVYLERKKKRFDDFYG